MSSIDRHRERSIVSKHPGATAKQIKHYIEYFLNEEDLHGVIIVAGLNDLLYSSNNGRNDVIMEDIVAHVIQAGLKAREAGIMNVHLSGLFKVENVRDEHINLFNYLLKQRCKQLGFGFIFNSNIELNDLYDGLHVNNKLGNMKLKHNILQCFDSYSCGH